ncbi:E3 SUMO-protein ligase RanBP2-like [Gigantopelta aegis]|uniref:E3 SUMO-protein ligase RanBP2-like n=1 Tax=Gigantopelta aegis TaxID=1735272 RepID=UPI001B887A7E|nr:E3 SUMO-protein ligase RanBP2-like [Gigantopelta aegis]
MAENIVVPILEIREEFATCEICLDNFDDGVRTPRTLPCLHTFCCDCLEKMWGAAAQGVKCPKCRKIWPVQGSIKSSFRQNSMLMHMVEYIGFKKKLGDVLCYQCPDNNKAIVRCLECEKYLCETCDRWHARFLEQHKPVPLTELVNTPRKFLKKPNMCPVHGEKNIDVYCKGEACEKAMCTTCALVSHKEHDICDLREFCDANKKKISSSLEALKKASELRTEYKSKVVGQNAKLDKIQEQVMKDIDEHSSKLVEKVEKTSKTLKKKVMENVAKQKAKRDEQLALVEKSEELKAEHVLYCQQALLFARDVEFIEMTKSLKKKGKSLMEDLQLPDLQVENVLLNTETYKKAELSIGQISIQEISFADDKFKPKPGIWECTGCYCRNDANVHQCPACQTLKLGINKEDIEQKSQSQAEGISGGGGFKFGSAGGFTFGKAQSKDQPIDSLFKANKPEGTTADSKGPSSSGGFTFGSTLAALLIADEEPSPTSDRFSFAPAAKTGGFNFGGAVKSGGFQFNLGKVTTPTKDQKNVSSDGKASSFQFSFSPTSKDKSSIPPSPKSPVVDEHGLYINKEGGDSHIYFEPVVQLPDKIEVKTGEEDESVLFEHRAKLYRFDNGEWKERGLGNVKILENRLTKKIRILMRREQVLKLCLNHMITSDLQLNQMPRSDGKAWIWYAQDFSDDEPKIEQFTIRFKTAEIADSFKAAFEDARSKMSEGPMQTASRQLFASEGNIDLNQLFEDYYRCTQVSRLYSSSDDEYRPSTAEETPLSSNGFDLFFMGKRADDLTISNGLLDLHLVIWDLECGRNLLLDDIANGHWFANELIVKTEIVNNT